MSKSRRLAVLALTGFSFALILFAQDKPEETLVIDHVTYFDGNGGPVIKNGAIVIQGDRIKNIGRRGNIRPGPGITILDATGKFAFPGLIDAHVHFDQSADIY